MANASLGERADFQSLIDHLDGVAFWVASEPDRCDYVSAGFEEIWGIPPEAVREDISRLLESIHPEDRDRVRSMMEQSEGELSEEVYEGRVVRPDGSVRWVQTRQVPLRDAEGNLTEVVGISTDITEQKRREEELATLNRIIRHDIRNDMSVILGWGELLQAHIDESGESHLEKMLSASTHVVELTEIAGEYAEVVTGIGNVEREPVPLRSILQREVELCRDSFPGAMFVVEEEFPSVEVMANEMLASVFKNLLRNAVQHNDKDEPLVEVSCELQARDAVVRIADNGPGIPEDQRETIFEKGEKGIESSGTGIGLYLVGTLVSQYGGQCWIEDNTPTGSVFVVQLPRAG